MTDPGGSGPPSQLPFGGAEPVANEGIDTITTAVDSAASDALAALNRSLDEDTYQPVDELYGSAGVTGVERALDASAETSMTAGPGVDSGRGAAVSTTASIGATVSGGAVPSDSNVERDDGARDEVRSAAAAPSAADLVQSILSSNIPAATLPGMPPSLAGHIPVNPTIAAAAAAAVQSGAVPSVAVPLPTAIAELGVDVTVPNSVTDTPATTAPASLPSLAAEASLGAGSAAGRASDDPGAKPMSKRERERRASLERAKSPPTHSYGTRRHLVLPKKEKWREYYDWPIGPLPPPPPAIPELSLEQPLSWFEAEFDDTDMRSDVFKTGEDKPITLTDMVTYIKRPDFKKLPQISYRDLDVDDSVLPPELRQDFSRPASFIRSKIPDDEEMYDKVEYDLDSDDDQWMQEFNHGRRRVGLQECTPADLELIIDRLEKSAYDEEMSKTKAALDLDDNCAVCDSGTSEDSNQIVFCDGCNLGVHQDCYGVRYIPEGRWLCRKCESGEPNITCIFCPNLGGAFKRTIDGRWAHVVCALWIPETSFSSDVLMEPVEFIDNIPKARWKLMCYLCEKRKRNASACIQCSYRTCAVAFHVTCARKHGLYMEVKEDVARKTVNNLSYCHRHNPDPDADTRAFPKKIRGSPDKRQKQQQQSSIDNGVSLSAAALGALSRKIKVPSQLVNGVYEHWKDKRRFRGPLVKRLQPFARRVIQDFSRHRHRKAGRRDFRVLHKLRLHLEHLRTLTEVVRKRERLKRTLVRRALDSLDFYGNPLQYALVNLIGELRAIDVRGIFQQPVSAEFVPDYYDIIKEPMDFQTLENKVKANDYASFDEFKTDVSLIWKNAMVYNKPLTVFHRHAKTLRDKAQELFDEHSEIQSLFDKSKWPLVEDFAFGQSYRAYSVEKQAQEERDAAARRAQAISDREAVEAAAAARRMVTPTSFLNDDAAVMDTSLDGLDPSATGDLASAAANAILSSPPPDTTSAAATQPSDDPMAATDTAADAGDSKTIEPGESVPGQPSGDGETAGTGEDGAEASKTGDATDQPASGASTDNDGAVKNEPGSIEGGPEQESNPDVIDLDIPKTPAAPKPPRPNHNVYDPEGNILWSPTFGSWPPSESSSESSTTYSSETSSNTRRRRHRAAHPSPVKQRVAKRGPAPKAHGKGKRRGRPPKIRYDEHGNVLPPRRPGRPRKSSPVGTLAIPVTIATSKAAVATGPSNMTIVINSSAPGPIATSSLLPAHPGLSGLSASGSVNPLAAANAAATAADPSSEPNQPRDVTPGVGQGEGEAEKGKRLVALPPPNAAGRKLGEKGVPSTHPVTRSDYAGSGSPLKVHVQLITSASGDATGKVSMAPAPQTPSGKKSTLPASVNSVVKREQIPMASGRRITLSTAVTESALLDDSSGSNDMGTPGGVPANAPAPTSSAKKRKRRLPLDIGLDAADKSESESPSKAARSASTPTGARRSLRGRMDT